MHTAVHEIGKYDGLFIASLSCNCQVVMNSPAFHLAVTVVLSQDKTEEETLAFKRKEGVRLKRKAEEDRRVGLFSACREGNVEEVRAGFFGSLS